MEELKAIRAGLQTQQGILQVLVGEETIPEPVVRGVQAHIAGAIEEINEILEHLAEAVEDDEGEKQSADA